MFNQVVITLIAIQVLFGLNFSASKIIVSQTDPLWWGSIRFFIAAIIFHLFALSRKTQRPKLNINFIKRLFLFSGLGMGAGQGFFLIGLEKTTSINTALITSTMPILTLVIVIIQGKEELTLKKLLSFGFAITGIILTLDVKGLSFGANHFVGNFFVFLGALSFALYLSLSVNFLKGHDKVWLTTYMFYSSGLILLVFALLLSENFNFVLNDSTYLVSASYSIIGATLLTYFLNNWVLTKTDPSKVAIYIYLQPVVASIVGVLFLNEVLSMRILLSGLLICLGLVISQLNMNLEKLFKRNDQR